MEKFDKKYYKISEVAEMIGLPCSTLRFWESRFTIISPRRNRAGTRFYTPSDVEKLRMVAFLVKEKGLRLEAAQEELRNNHTGVSRRAMALNRLHDVTVGYDHDILQRVNIYSAYLQNEWRNDRWGFLIGARLDKHSMVRRPIVSPRANIRFNPTENINLRLSYSTGFRSPQAYDEDFHVAIVGGERVVTVLAPGLRQESSNSLSASADLYRRFGRVQCNLTLEGFYTDLRHVFALRKLATPDAAGNTVLERYNGGGATVAGANIEAKVSFGSPLWIQAGFTWQRSRYKQPEQWSENPEVPAVRRMFRTPDTYGYLTFNWDFARHWSLALSGTYTGSMLVQHMEGSGTPIDRAVTTGSFFDAGAKINYELKVFHTACLDFSAGITNIFNSYQNDFDHGENRDSGYIYGPSLPRSLQLAVKLHI